MDSNKDQLEGQFRVLRGSAKVIVGKALGDRRMRIRGTFERALGVFQIRMGNAWQDIKDDGRAN
jgi:uncharacterized protein YjbJ (UPF0337 family)